MDGHDHLKINTIEKVKKSKSLPMKYDNPVPILQMNKILFKNRVDDLTQKYRLELELLFFENNGGENVIHVYNYDEPVRH